MKKSVLSLIIVVTILIGAVACGTNTDKQVSKKDVTSTTTTTTTTELVTTSTTTTTTKKVESTKPTTTKTTKKKVNKTTKKTTTKKKGNNSGKPSNNKVNNPAPNKNTGSAPSEPAPTSAPTTTTTKVTKALTEKEVYDAMIAVKKRYPTGHLWNNDDFYPWKGGLGYAGGRGCAGFAFLLSDAAFGDRPARKVNTLDNLKVGDIIRYLEDGQPGNGHYIMVIGISGETLTLAEGNMVIDGKPGVVYWGRTITKTEIMNNYFKFVITRW